MSYGELSAQVKARNERAELIVTRLSQAGWQVTLPTVLRSFSVFDRWASGLMSTGYLAKMTGIRRKGLSENTVSLMDKLANQIRSANCECRPAQQLLNMAGPLIDHIRGIICDDCGRILYVSDTNQNNTARNDGIKHEPNNG